MLNVGHRAALLSRKPQAPDFWFDALGGGDLPECSHRITFGGGANGTRVDRSGTIVTASCPRIDFDPASRACLGMLMEQQRANLLLNSTIDGANLATQSVTLTAVAHTLSFYGTGTVALSGAATGSLVGAGAFPTRSTLVFTPSAGSVTFTVTGTVQYAQLEVGGFETSYIPTAGASVTRTNETAVCVDFLQAALRSFSDAGSREWTIYCEWSTPMVGKATEVVLEVKSVADGNTTGRRVNLSGRRGSSQLGRAQSFPQAVSLYSVDLGSAPSSNQIIRSCFSGSPSGHSFFLNSGSTLVNSNTTAFVGFTANQPDQVSLAGTNNTIYGSATTLGANSHLRRVMIWQTRLSASSMRGLVERGSL